MREVFGALSSLCESQGSTLKATLHEDTAGLLKVKIPDVVDLKSLVRGAGALKNPAFQVRIGSPSEDGPAGYLTMIHGDEWRVPPTAEVPWVGLPSVDMTDTWNSADVVNAATDSGSTVWAEILYDKSDWRRAVEEECGRSSWIGFSLGTFEEWLRGRSWKQIAPELFERSAGLVLIYSWDGTPLRLGNRLTVGSLETREHAPEDPLWPVHVVPWLLRAAHLDPALQLDEEWHQRLSGIGGAAAATCLVGTPPTAASSHVPLVWKLPDRPMTDPTDVSSVLALVRWTSAEPTHTRLRVAQLVAYERVTDPLASNVLTVTESAEIAYSIAVRRHVRDSLERQADLEKTFLQMDSDVAVVREKLRGTIESTITRALAAVVAIAIAGLTTDEARGWPTVVAGTGVALYLLFEATVGLEAVKHEAVRRIEAFESLVNARDLGLGTSLLRELSSWKADFVARVRGFRTALLAVAIVAFIALAVGATLDEGAEEHQPPPTPSQTSR